MTVSQFRRLALNLPQTTEGAHMNHPDFRVKGKIFATLFQRDDVDWGMVKLKPEQQREYVEAGPRVFQPVKGEWGRRGCTQVSLHAVDRKSLAIIRSALFSAWLSMAPKSLVEELDRSDADSRKPRRRKA